MKKGTVKDIMDCNHLELELGRDIEEVLYDELEECNYEKLIKAIMGRSHLVFTIVYKYPKCLHNSYFMMYIDEKIDTFNCSVLHSNTKSFVSDYMYYHTPLLEFKVEDQESESVISFKFLICLTVCDYEVKKTNQIKGDSSSYNILRMRVFQMKKTEEEIEKEKETEAWSKLNNNCMVEVGKYFNSINDFFNIERTCKEYRGIMEQYLYNPVPLQRTKERELFKNIKTYYMYGKQKKIRNIEKDKKIEHFIHLDKMTYSKWKKDKETLTKQTNHLYKVEYSPSDRYKLYDKGIYDMEGITSIGEKCFNECTKMQSLTIPSTVTSIGSSCFSHCTRLTEINILGSVTSLDYDTFDYCYNLQGVVIPTSVISLGDSCFRNCEGLKEMIIPNGVTYIGRYCFYSCRNLRRINIPSTVYQLGYCCFDKCSVLNDIKLEEGNTVYYREGNMIKKRKTEELIYYVGCNGLNEFSVPTTVKSLQSGCFSSSCYLKKVKIPTTVTSLGDYCFNDCYLREINIPTSVKSIGDKCFADRGLVVEIDIPTSVTSIGVSCFKSCECAVNLPTSIKSLPPLCFVHCNMETITIPTSVSFISECCFNFCTNLKSINIPTSVVAIGRRCFYCCSKLSSINIPSSISYISESCFSGCSNLMKIHLPSSIYYCDEACFMDCIALLGHISIDKKNPLYETDGMDIYTKKGHLKLSVWNPLSLPYSMNTSELI